MGIFNWLHERAVLNKKRRFGARQAEQERMAAAEQERIAAAERMQENLRLRAQENKRRRFGRH